MNSLIHAAAGLPPCKCCANCSTWAAMWTRRLLGCVKRPRSFSKDCSTVSLFNDCCTFNKQTKDRQHAILRSNPTAKLKTAGVQTSEQTTRLDTTRVCKPAFQTQSQVVSRLNRDELVTSRHELNWTRLDVWHMTKCDDQNRNVSRSKLHTVGVVRCNSGRFRRVNSVASSYYY